MENLKKIPSAIINVLKSVDKYFIILSVFFFVFLILYWGRFGDPVIDCGREAYIPYAMADLGKVLFKDIICIYGPVPYYLNALIVKFLGTNLNTMYLIGAFLSYIFLFGIYNLAKRFIGAGLAFIFSGIIIFCCILNTSISNYIFPYSYAIVYSLVFAAFHLVFMYKFIDIASSAGNAGCKNLCISAFFLSLCLLSKLDFLPCVIPFLIILFLYRKKLNCRAFAMILVSFLSSFLFVAIILLLQKVSLQNLIFNFKMISNMAHSPSLEYFYSVCTGYFFEFKKTFMFVKEFLLSSAILLLAGILGNFALKIKNNFLSICISFAICTFAAYIILVLNLLRYIFLYIPLLVSVFLVVKCIIYIVKKYKNSSIKIPNNDIIKYSFILFSVLFSLKSLFGLFHELYGTFYLPFILLSFIIIILLVFRKNQPQAAGIFKIIGTTVIFLFIFQNFIVFNLAKNTPVKSKQGVIYTEKTIATSLNFAINFLEANLKKDETLLVLPEGLFVNFILKKDYPYYNTSFTPLDFDAYGEKYLTEHLLANQPNYIVFLSRSYQDYNKTFICTDFGVEFCNVVFENYTLKTQFGSNTFTKLQKEPLIQIFERKDDD